MGVCGRGRAAGGGHALSGEACLVLQHSADSVPIDRLNILLMILLVCFHS